ncbi:MULTISPECIES: PspA-associated protein PspAB [unclassified Streptomyces]|uniref:PspA-associated protein PspAB n=1 Tax=unclassified Streptomyces TaxID=2593676 RepID=UPI0016605364|nr:MULTISPECIES: hypothetical protein [unclassified Streptomyces]MBD0711480.1 hypothetical protein [Streptomyces sp. CBMA291]MBD0716015.1 hypothetical protein [Streptomyces sp. CBMA370]
MGFLDTVLGRSRPVRPDLDRLFGLPGAAITLRAGAGFVPTGTGSVCFAAVEGGAFARLKEEVRSLLDVDEGVAGGPVAYSGDAYGYTWLTVRRPGDDLVTLVNDLHAVNTLLQEAGFGPNLLCSLAVFRAEEGGGDGEGRGARDLALVYLYKRGTFYPFAPYGDRAETRDNVLELQVRALLADDLAVEPETDRWFPVWGAPGLGGG